MPCYVLVRNGVKAVESVLEDYRRMIYRYNGLLRGTGFYLKPVHIVTKRVNGEKYRYIYVGRYWWRVSYAGKRGRVSRVKWVYVGREKPRELSHLPDPPSHPVAGLSYTVLEGGDILVRREVYEKFKWVFEGYEVESAGCR